MIRRAESAALGPRGVTRAVEKKHSVVNSNQTQSNSTTVHDSAPGAAWAAASTPLLGARPLLASLNSG